MVKWVCLQGLSSYLKVIEEMDLAVNKIISSGQEMVYLVEHENTYTAGTSADDKDLLSTGNIPIFNVGRGGKHTYHGPGQRVIYPILSLGSPNRKKDIKLYITELQHTVIQTLKYFGVSSFACPDNIGIWVHRQDHTAKIASIGIRVRKWVTFHGIAINIATDLTKFDGIIPCGLSNSRVTSLKELGVNITMNEFDEVYKKYFTEVFGCIE